MGNDDFLKTLQEIFESESKDQMIALDHAMERLEKALSDQSLFSAAIGDVFRVVHSLKASTGSLGYEQFMDWIHKFESYLHALRSGEKKYDQSAFTLIQRGVDLVHDDVEKSIATLSDVASRSEDPFILDLLKDEKASEASVATPSSLPIYQIVIRPYADLLKDGYDPISFLSDLYDSGEVLENRCNVANVPSLERFHHDELYLTWEIILKTEKKKEEIENIFIFMFFQSEIVIEEITASYHPSGEKIIHPEKKLGEILIERGDVTHEVVESALSEQKRLGEILVKDEQISPETLKKAVAEQDKARGTNVNSIRVDVSKLDALVNFVGELVIAQSRIENVVLKVTNKKEKVELLERCNELSRLIEELQQSAMSTRMVPVELLFGPFPRLVREVAQKQEKSVRLVLSGQETELDKSIIEKLADPLKHLVRNALDHGAELPEVRALAGKPKEAIITLRAFQREGNVYLEIKDDGKGLDKKKILEVAIKRGVITDGAHLDDQEVYDLIFRPGFSTAEKVTEISGRGVGMDVVKGAIDEIGGGIEIKTEEGRGTTFLIKLPLTLAIVEGLLFRVGKEIFVVPLLHVAEAVCVKANEIETINGKAECLSRHGKISTMIRLGKVFNIPGCKENPEEAMFLSVAVNQRSYSLMIDEVLGQQKVVLKSLESNYKKVEGFSSVTILGNGSVAPIIDPVGIVQMYKRM